MIEITSMNEPLANTSASPHTDTVNNNGRNNGNKNITLSVTRAMIDTTTGTKNIFSYFNCTRKPKKKVDKQQLLTQVHK